MLAKTIAALLFILLCGACAPAAAATCAVSAPPLTFSAVDTLTSAGASTSAEMAIDCSGVSSSAVALCVNLGTGDGGADGGERLMTLLSTPSATLRYGLYAASGSQTRWGGNQTPELGEPQKILLSAVSDGTAHGSLAVYGVVDGNQPSKPTGTYSAHFTSSDVVVDYSENSALDCANPAGAAETSATFTVTAVVEPNCNVSATDLDFGSIGRIDADLAAESTLHVTCTPGAAYSIAMGNGLHYDGSSRRMTSASGDFVSYGLFRDDGALHPWGSASGTDTLDGTATGTDDQTIYGIVPQQPARAGQYQDTVVVTIVYQ